MTQYGNEDYLSPEEAAALLGVSRRTLERYVKSNNIPRYRRGLKSVVFRRSDIEQLLEPRREENQ